MGPTTDRDLLERVGSWPCEREGRSGGSVTPPSRPSGSGAVTEPAVLGWAMPGAQRQESHRMGALWSIGVRWSGPPQLATPRPVKFKSLGVGLGTNVLKPSQVTQAQPGLSTSQDLHWPADLCTNGGECDHRCLSLSWERANCVGRQRDLSYFINMPF